MKYTNKMKIPFRNDHRLSLADSRTCHVTRVAPPGAARTCSTRVSRSFTCSCSPTSCVVRSSSSPTRSSRTRVARPSLRSHLGASTSRFSARSSHVIAPRCCSRTMPLTSPRSSRWSRTTTCCQVTGGRRLEIWGRVVGL